MKRYKWIKHFENWNNRGYSLHDNTTCKNIAWIEENNHCDYKVHASDYILAAYRYPHTLAATMEACAKSAGIHPEEIEEYK